MNASPLIARGAAIAIAIAGVTSLAFWANDSAASQKNPVAGAMPYSAEYSAVYVDLMCDHVVLQVEATGTGKQRVQIDALFDQARRELASLDAQMQENNKLSLAILSQDRVDGAELEDVRQDSIRLADQVSQRMTQLVADIADALTPAQRKALAESAHGPKGPGR